MILFDRAPFRLENWDHPGLVFARLELSSEREAPPARPLDSNRREAGRSTALIELLRPAPSERPADAVDRQIGRYRLIERLGQGSQGEIWKALRVEPSVAVVALKVLGEGPARDPRRLGQFRREAEIRARLDSPGLLPIHEFGISHGSPFMAMPLVDGGTLAELIARRRERVELRSEIARPWWGPLCTRSYTRAVVRMLARIADTVEYVHARGIAHRDIKPENILLDRCREDAVYLGDFGLSRPLDEPRSTCLEDGAGTPLYMAPEKLLGRDCDEVRCDVFSLGVTLFEAVTLIHPFPIPRNLPRSCLPSYLAETIAPRPGTLRPDLPEALEAILLRAMQRDPGRRFPTAGALAEALRRFLVRERR